MKVVVVVGRRFHQEDGEWFSMGAAGPETGERYLTFFENVTLCARRLSYAKLVGNNQLTPLNSRIQIIMMPNLSSPVAQVTKTGRLKRLFHSVFSDADAVIVRLPNQNGFIATAVALQMNKPLACDIGGRSMDALSNHGSPIAKMYAPFSELRMRYAVQRCDYVSYVTQNYLQECYPACNGAVTFAGSNVEIPSPSHLILDRRRYRQASYHEELVFGTIGSLTGWMKGIHIALEAFTHVPSSFPPWRYRVLGAGDPEPFIKIAESLGIADKVDFDGTLPSGNPVYRWLDKIDVYIQPSLREGLPRAVIEAMSRGCPVVATSVGGTTELLEPDDLVPAGNVQALLDALVRSVSRNWQSHRALRNWKVSHTYSSDSLGKKRSFFWTAFAEFSKQKKVR